MHEPAHEHSRSRGHRICRFLLHPLLSLLALTLFLWNFQHWPPQRSDNWTPGARAPTGSLATNALERRTLAWAFREGDGWRFVISPLGNEDAAAACTVNVLIDHGAYGWPYPVEVGWWSTRALMNQRETITQAERPALYAAAAAFLEARPDTAEAAFADVIRQPGRTELRPVPFGGMRNAGAVTLAILGPAGAIRCFAAAVIWTGALLRARHLRRLAATALKAEMCPACAYDWRGLPERRCPECGFAPAATPNPALIRTP